MKYIIMSVMTACSSFALDENGKKSKLDIQFICQYAFVDTLIADITVEQILLENMSGKQTDYFNKLVSIRMNGCLEALISNFEKNKDDEYKLKCKKSVNITIANLKIFAINNPQYEIKLESMEKLLKMKTEK